MKVKIGKGKLFFNTNQTQASKSCLNCNFKILTKPCTQSLNKSLALSQDQAPKSATLTSSSASAAVTTSTSFEMPSSHARVTSSKFTKRQLVSQLVTRGDKGRQWSDSGPIKSESENTNQLLNVKNCFYFCLFALKVELHELNFKIGQILWSNHLRGMNDRWQSKQRRKPGVNRTSDFHHQLCIWEALCIFGQN